MRVGGNKEENMNNLLKVKNFQIEEEGPLNSKK